MSSQITSDAHKELTAHLAGVPGYGRPSDVELGCVVHAEDRSDYIASAPESLPQAITTLLEAEGASAALAASSAEDLASVLGPSHTPREVKYWLGTIPHPAGAADVKVAIESRRQHLWSNSSREFGEDSATPPRNLDTSCSGPVAAVWLAQTLERICGDDPSRWAIALSATFWTDPAHVETVIDDLWPNWLDRISIVRRAKRDPVVRERKSQLLTRVPEKVAGAWLKEGVTRTLNTPFREDYSWAFVKTLIAADPDPAEATGLVRGADNIARTLRTSAYYPGPGCWTLLEHFPDEAVDAVRHEHSPDSLPEEVQHRLLRKHGPISWGGSADWAAKLLSSPTVLPWDSDYMTSLHSVLEWIREDTELDDAVVYALKQALTSPRVPNSVLWNAPDAFYAWLLRNQGDRRVQHLAFETRWRYPEKQAAVATAALRQVDVHPASMQRLMQVSPEVAALVVKPWLGTDRCAWNLWLESLDSSDRMSLMETFDAATSAVA